MDEKQIKRIDSLYRNCKQMPLLCVLGLLVPIVLLFVAPLSLVYAGQRRRLLEQLDDAEIPTTLESRSKDMTVSEQVEFLRDNGSRFYIPLIVFVAVVVIIVAFVAFT